MTDRAILAALLARVLEGTGPDRELDRCIHEALGFCTHRKSTRYTAQGDSGFTCDACGVDLYGDRGWPSYTGSLDAVLRDLLLKGWDWRRRSNLTMALVYGESEKYDLVAVHHEPCRALIAACLKAMMEKLGE
jgi:hypothetical protein